MNKIIIIIITIVLITSAASVFGQQSGMFAQYNESLIMYNPAFTGYRNSINASMFYKMQWAGFEGAPTSQMIAIDTKVRKTEFSFGGIVFLDKAGPLKQKTISFSASYRLKIDRTNFLSFGMKLSGFVYDVSLTDRNIVNETDEVYFENVNSLFQPNTGFGFLYTSNNFFVSLSSPNILKNQLDRGGYAIVNRDNTKNATHYLMAGYLYKIDKLVSIKTILLGRATEGSPYSAGINSTLIINDTKSHRRIRPDKINIGVNYYYQEQLAFFTQLRVERDYLIGYSISIPTSKLIGYSGLTHELMVNYSLRYTRRGRRKIISPAKF